MKRNEILNSVSLKKRFCKDCNLPISVFDNPYFEHRLNCIALLPQYRNCIDKFKLFIKEVEDFPNEQAYFEYYNRIKDTAMSYIKERPLWQAFNEMKINNIVGDMKKYPDRNLYIEPNDGHKFISIDMKHANFTILRHFSDENAESYKDDIFDGYKTWEEFLGQITNCRHILESKYIRQVIFGNCNPKKQIQYEKFLMDNLAHNIEVNLPFFGLTSENIFCVHNDEIIIQADSFTSKAFDEFKEFVKGDGSVFVIDSDRLKVEWFMLRKIPNVSGWLKINPDYDREDFNFDINAVEVKSVDSEILPQVIRYLAQQPIEDEDLAFFHNGQLAKFLNPIPNLLR